MKKKGWKSEKLHFGITMFAVFVIAMFFAIDQVKTGYMEGR